MEWIFFKIYICIAFLSMFLYEKMYPFEEDETLEFSNRYQKRMYNSMMTMAAILWPILLLEFLIRWALDFVKWLKQKKNK